MQRTTSPPTPTTPPTSTTLPTSTWPAPPIAAEAPAAAGRFLLPWLPEGRTVQIQGRGEFFVRVHRHADPDAPVVLLLHGWTASADLQFFTAYRALAERCSFVAIDHRGHGRGLRTSDRFLLEDAADDAAAVVHALGIDAVVTVGYSMGGPVSMHLAHRHPGLVTGMVLQATALEFNGTWMERLTWLWLPMFGSMIRSWVFPRWMRHAARRRVRPGHPLATYVPWLLGEIQRGSAHALVDAGTALRHHDARPWAPSLGVPAAVLLTTRDRLVKPRKQRVLAEAIGASVRELAADHFCTFEQPDDYARLTVALVDDVVRRARQVTASRAS